MNEIPEWMSKPKRKRANEFVAHELALPKGNRQILIELEKQDFEIAFETALEELGSGRTLVGFCNDYHRPLSATRFRTWIFSNPRRKEAYLAAKAIGAETVEDDLIRIADGLEADGTPSMNEVQRSTLQINTRKWLLGVWNRKRYGDIKHIEQTTSTTVDVTSMSTAQLQEKVLESLGMSGDVFDGTFEEICDDDT